MNLKEIKKNNYNSVLYIIRTINRIYYLLSCQEKDNQEKYYQELQKILFDFKQEQEVFTHLAASLEENAPFKCYQGIAIKLLEEDLETLLEKELENTKTFHNNLFYLIFKRINNYTLSLENKYFDINTFKDLTDYISSLIYNFKEETFQVFTKEIAYLFVETLRKIGIDNLDKLISNTNPYFYSSIISLGEEYIYNVILKNEKNPLYIELQDYKLNNSEELYLKVLYEQAFKLKIMTHESIFIRTRKK